MLKKELKAKIKIALQKGKQTMQKLTQNCSQRISHATEESLNFLRKKTKENPKQLIGAVSLLVFAIILLVVLCNHSQKSSDAEENAVAEIQSINVRKEVAVINDKVVVPTKKAIKIEPENAVLTFLATSEKDFTYEIYYTVEREVWFVEKYKIEYPGKAGQHKYSIVLPEKNVYRIRIDFGSNPGKVTIKDIYMTGSQQADLNNINRYELNQMDKTTLNKDGSLTFISTQEDPYMAYRLELINN